ncbi:Cloroperoxidase [Exidia glandulosa HHB12029]|uniref:Cloroperoxidase n=1 Tax=Exidia glandulosa HHB12029 TaxID=1314781 RepID=A0A165FJU1_EXIGL|nr:Cloroperoxidase [Exidia glandulosa HHB12029]
MFLLSHIYIVLALQLGGVFGVALRPYESLAGLTREEVDAFARSVKVVGGQPVPPAIKDTSSKLVNDKAHPWFPLAPGQQRGPCPGLNTLASHGYLPRSGVASPGQIVTAVQEGFNMAWDLATLVTYGAFLVDGNPLTNLMSIGSTSRLTGPAPPKPALVSGLSTHGTFEGDASMTRSDAFLGDNHSFNETLFDQLVQISKEVGGGKYNVSAAAEVRFQRFQDSVARNPTFNFANPRFATAFVETIFPLAFFIDGRDKSLALDLDVMRGFFKDSRMPHDFHRREGAFEGGGDEFDIIQSSHNYFPGFNNGTVNNFVPDPNFLGTQTEEICALYEKFVNTTMELYPNPQGALRKALNVNLDNFFIPVSSGCTQLHPFP